MKKLITAFTVLFLFALPAISQAQTSWGIGPRIGYYEPVDAESGNFLIGVQLRGRLSPYFGVEAAVEYRSTSEYTIGDGSYETGFVPITASALVYLPLSEHFQPYGVAGLGAYYTYYDTETALSDQFEGEFNFGYHLGFGLEIPIDDAVALNADYRYIFLNPEEGENDFSGHAVTAGLMFYF